MAIAGCVNSVTLKETPPLIVPEWPDLEIDKDKLEEPKFITPPKPTIIRITPDFEVLLKIMNSMPRDKFDLWLFDNYPMFKLWLDTEGYKFLKENFDIDDPNDKKYQS
jgi:hypothetical protein